MKAKISNWGELESLEGENGFSNSPQRREGQRAWLGGEGGGWEMLAYPKQRWQEKWQVAGEREQATMQGLGGAAREKAGKTG